MIYSDLKDKLVLVTGCSSGIGKAQVNSFLENGCYVIGVDKNICPMINPNFRFIKCDLSDQEKVNKALKNIDADIVCNTAGILDDYCSINETGYQLWDKVMRTNVYSQFMVSKLMLPNMIRRKKGVFINMASIAGKIAGGGGVSYTASKHAVIGLMKQLNFDYAKYGIRANCIAPGAIKTNMNISDFNNGGLIAKEVKKSTPANRYADPTEVADLTVFLASDVSSYLYGNVVEIDGGWSIDKLI